MAFLITRPEPRDELDRRAWRHASQAALLCREPRVFWVGFGDMADPEPSAGRQAKGRWYAYYFSVTSPVEGSTNAPMSVAPLVASALACAPPGAGTVTPV